MRVSDIGSIFNEPLLEKLVPFDWSLAPMHGQRLFMVRCEGLFPPMGLL